MAIILFGASKLGEEAFKTINRYENVKYFCDNDPNKWGKLIKGKVCINPKDLCKYPDYKIVISSMYDNEIIKQLESFNLKNKVFIYEQFISKWYSTKIKVKNKYLYILYTGIKKTYVLKKQKKLNYNFLKKVYSFKSKDKYSENTIKIAVFDHIVNGGGGSRYLRCLLPKIKKQRNNYVIDFYGDRKGVIRENLQEEFSDLGINVKYLNCNNLNVNPSLSLQKEIERKSKYYDLLFFPWPYMLNCPCVDIPMIAIFHDFNFKYFFGQEIFSGKCLQQLNDQTELWMNKANIIVSSKFMKEEVNRFYNIDHNVNVINMASFSSNANFTYSQAKNIIKNLGVNFKYIIYPCNYTYHKNISILLYAFYLLKKKGYEIKLILTGDRSKNYTGKISEFGIIPSNDENFDVLGVGYVTNDEIDALIQCAEVVVSTSMYEAGNGPGIDAWLKGVPVAMSNIQPFVEHIENVGVRAQVFDNRNAYDIEEKIAYILENYEEAQKDAQFSKKMISKLTWDKIALKYISVFENTLKLKES